MSELFGPVVKVLERWRGSHLRWSWVVMSILVAVACVPCIPEAAASDDLEHVVKAGFIYNFTKFIEWPESAFADPEAPIVIGILGKDPFGKQLDEAIKGETSRGRPLVVQRFERAEEAKACHLLFVANSEVARLKEVLRTIQGTPVVTVGEADDFVEGGGVIGFQVEEGRVRFIVNVDAAARTGAKIGSQMLNLSKIRREKP